MNVIFKIAYSLLKSCMYRPQFGNFWENVQQKGPDNETSRPNY